MTYQQVTEVVEVRDHERAWLGDGVDLELESADGRTYEISETLDPEQDADEIVDALDDGDEVWVDVEFPEHDDPYIVTIEFGRPDHI